MQIQRRCAAGDGRNEMDGGNRIVEGVELKWLRKNLVRQDQRICHVLEFSRNSARFRGGRAGITARRRGNIALFQRAVERVGARAHWTRAKSAEQ